MSKWSTPSIGVAHSFYIELALQKIVVYFIFQLPHDAVASLPVSIWGVCDF